PASARSGRMSPMPAQNVQPWPEKPAGDDDVWLFGQRVNDERLCRRAHEHAGLTGRRRPHRSCTVPLHAGQHGDVLRRDLAVDVSGSGWSCTLSQRQLMALPVLFPGVGGTGRGGARTLERGGGRRLARGGAVGGLAGKQASEPPPYLL